MQSDNKGKVLLVMRYFLASDAKSPSAKVFPKFDRQIEAIREMGYDCIHYAIANGRIYRVYNGESEFVKRLPFANMPILHRLSEHAAIYGLCAKEAKETKPEFTYIRNTPVVRQYLTAMKAFHCSGSKVIVEIPTYPPEKEIGKEKRLWRKLTYGYMESIGKKAAKYVDLYTLIGETGTSLYGRPAMNILNGTSVGNYKQHTTRPDDGTVHILALAGMANYHGFDRLIRGMNQYRQSGGKTPVYLHLVGPDVDGSLKEWLALTNKLQLDDCVIPEGELTGDALDDMFDRCDIACSSIAGFRIGIRIELNLKAAEYCSRGIPFLCCGIKKNPLLNIPHCYDAIPETEEPVDISAVAEFALKEKQLPDVSDEMRTFARGLSWKSQFEKVFANAASEVD